MSEWNPMRQDFERSPLALADFLLARIAEDRADADRAAARRPFAADFGLPEPGSATETVNLSAAVGMAAVPHITRWSPARVLAECEAKRRIVELHREHQQRPFASTSRPTLELLALPYADHPDYRPEWRP